MRATTYNWRRQDHINRVLAAARADMIARMVAEDAQQRELEAAQLSSNLCASEFSLEAH